MISNKQNFVIFPGISYIANGPSWVDKIKITADINGIPCDLYKMKWDGGIDFYKAYDSITAGGGQSIFNKSNGEVLFVYNSETDFNNFANLTSSFSAPGLCAAHFTGGYTDTLTFTLTLYTNINWISKYEGELGFGDPDAAYLKEVGLMKVRYNPYIVLSLPPEIHEGDWVEQDVAFTFTNLTKSISDFEKKLIYLDGGVDLITDYDNLPSVPIVETSLARKNSQKEVLDGDLYDIVSDKVKALNCQLLLFNANLPANFGLNESTKKEDKLAISAYRKSINGSRGRQRYTIVGVTKDLDTSSLSWEKTYRFDFSTLINSVKYYNTKAFGIKIQSTLDSDSISVSQPTQLYKHSNNIYTLLSGCSWEPVSGLNFGEYVLWDVWNEFAAHKDFVWTNMRGKALPKSCPTLPTGVPALLGNTEDAINSTANTTAGSLNLKIAIKELKNVNYLTFLDNDYSLRDLSKLAPNSLLLKHPVEQGYIQVSHAASEVSLGQTKINVTADLSNVPNSSNTSILSYITLLNTDSDNNIYSYPVADSINGGKQITSIDAVSNSDNIELRDGASAYNEVGSMAVKKEGLAYTLPPGGSITVKEVTAGSYLKYTAVYFDNDGILSILNSAFDSFIKSEDGNVVITNTSSNTVIVGSLGIILLQGDTSINDIALVHSVGCYEDVALFSDGVGHKKIEYKKIYFPPADTFCIGMYKITSSSTINLSDITTFYTTPEKNSIVKNALNNLQYRRASQ